MDGNGNNLLMANKYMFADFLIFMSGEGDEAMFPSFTISYVAIKASSTSVEALIASLLPASGTAKEDTFPMAINHMVAVGLLSLAQMVSGQCCHLAH